VIAGQPVRFNYVKVPAKSYGLSVTEILDNEERDLNKKSFSKKISSLQRKDKTIEIIIRT